MKSKTLTKRDSNKGNRKSTFSDVLRSARRNSAYAFAASLGIWLPRSEAATVINLDATGLDSTNFPSGLSTWTNTGTVVGDFTSSGGATPPVVTLDGVNAIAMTNAVGTAAGAAGLQYLGPVAPGSVCTNNPRTIEAWIYDVGGTNNYTLAGEKVLFGWGRRLSPGSFVFEHGWDQDNGAVNITAGVGNNVFNVGWGGMKNVTTNRWIYIVATYDGKALRVYSDGVLKNTRPYYVPNQPLTTFSLGSDNTTPMQFRVARQNLNGAPTGSASGTGIAPFYVSRIRVQDTNMTSAQVLAQYNAEKATFNYKDTDGDGMQDWYENRYGLNPNANDAAADPDGDGATNLQEFLAGSNPNVADTDGDGINDGAEINRIDPQTLLPAPTDPTMVDTDEDGLSDAVETDNGTTTSDPVKADTDGDNYSDGVEVAKGTNPLNAGSVPIPLIDLDATGIALGPLATWTNTGSAVGNFTSVSATNLPAVTNWDGVKGVRFTTVSVGGNGGSNGTSYFGPEAPTSVTAANPRTAEMWVFNNTIQDEETMLAWGGRATPAPGPTGENVSFGMGRNGAFGAVAQWGGPDIGWDSQDVHGRWVHLAYTHDGLTTRIYRDGQLVNQEAIPLITREFAPTDGLRYHFRIARQNGNVNIGTIDATGAGEFTVSKIKVFDAALDGPTIKAHFDADKATYGVTDTDGDGMPDWYEVRWGLNKNSAADAALDPDGDGLTNLQESQQTRMAPNANSTITLGTNPNVADTDADGLNDGAEVNRIDPQTSTSGETNPLLFDTDGDTLRDGYETDTGVFVSGTNTGSDPLKGDSDGDGFNDGIEVVNGSDPNNPLSIPNPPPLVNLVTTNLATGALINWTNLGTIGGVFTNGDGGGIVQSNQGVRSVTYSGGYQQGPPASTNLTGNPTYSIEAWVLNLQAAAEETVFSWGRRGGPDGSCAAFNHGTDVNFGAMTHWGGPDLGWGGASNVIQTRWTYIVYTYDGVSRQQLGYVDGRLVASETLAVPGLAIHTVDNSTNAAPLPMRVGSQNDADGTPSAGFRASLSIGELRVFGIVLTPLQVTNNFNAGANKYGILDNDGDGMPSWYERQYPGCLNENVAGDAATDCDGDGLTNLQEYNAFTSPINNDTDGDGILDGTETTNGTNPTNPDTDLDGLTDGKEAALGTAPLANTDSDGDGFLDYVEVLYGSNPTNNLSTPNLATVLPLVNLDATTLPLGSLPVWTNNNPLGWKFLASTNALSVSVVNGSKGVTFNGGNYYTGPGMPVYLSGNASRTVEAWILNPAAAGEETIFAWSRRGGNPDGSNSAFSHGTDAAFGAMQFWGAEPDVPWGTNAAQIAANVVTGAWTFVAYTYDSATQIKSAYKDGVLASTETGATPLATFLYDPGDPYNAGTPIGRSLPFRVGAQNDAGGLPSVPFATMTISKIRAYDTVLSALDIANHYNTEKVQYPGQPVITNVKVNSGTGVITFDWVPAPGKTYAVETNSNLENLGAWAVAATNQSSGSFTNNLTGAKTFYRLRIE